jgi:hypothetical protein
VDAENGRFRALAQDFRDGLVRDQHAFLDELVGLRVDDGVRLAGAAVLIELDLDLGHFEVERAVREAVFAEQGRHLPCLLHRAYKMRIGTFRCAFSVEDGLRLLVGKLRPRVDHGIDEFRE